MKTKIRLSVLVLLVIFLVAKSTTSFGQQASTAVPATETTFTTVTEAPDNSSQMSSLKLQIANFVPSYATSELNELHLALLNTQFLYESGLASGQLTQQELNDLQQIANNLQAKITAQDEQLTLTQTQQTNRQHANDKQWIQNNTPPPAPPAQRGPGLYPDNGGSVPATSPK